MAGESTESWSGSALWEAWYNDELNWQNLNLEALAETENPPKVESHIDDSTDEIIDQDWPLRDPNGFYYPLFGLGSTNSQVAIVGTGPGHNVESPWTEHIDSSEYREAINGPMKAEDDWYAADFNAQKTNWMNVRTTESKPLVKNLKKLQNALPDAEGPVFDNFYYTNLMKDGEFAKSREYPIELDGVNELSETADPDGHPSPLLTSRWPDINKIDSAAKVCEVASREFWLPVLGAELASVDPDVILPMGKKATLASFELYDIDDEFKNLYEVALASFESPEDGPTIIPSYHWSFAGPTISQIKDDLYSKLEEDVSARSDEKTTESYNRVLAAQIDKWT
jgi:uracil-DNA glycosylase